ncbi:MAG: DUF4350 domain-containing protein [Candidatus Thermoplasmatota archaeon]
MKKILFDEGHGNSRIEDFGKGGIFILTNELRKNGKEVSTIEKIDNINCDVLAILFPKKNFENDEIKAIFGFLENGGGLLLASEWGNIYGSAEILNKISLRFGIKFNKDRIVDRRDAYERSMKLMGETIGYEKAPQFAKIRTFSKHPITNGIMEIMHISGCSLDGKEENVIARSDLMSFGDVNGNAELDTDEKVCSFPTAIAAVVGNGRAVCIGDTSIATNEYIEMKDNKKFMLNIFSWLGKEI